ncbi:MAG: SUMF1/EgtB/PvdO family nonheme iron enzyme [Planctomycetota bacterium]
MIRGIDPKIEQRHPLAADLFKIDLATRDRKVAELESALAQPEQAPLELLREFEGVPWVDALYATRQSALASEVLARARAQHALAASQLQLPLARQDARSRIDLVLVPPGRFTMGDDWGDGDDDERPVVTVEISRPFYLGKHEVTQSEWQLVMGSNPARGEHGADLPVDGVSYEDVAEFLRKTGLRLPSEAEWEYAARAGCDFKYQIGSEGMHLDRVAWHAGNAEGRAHAVLGKEPNAWGIHDLLGNVQEWCATWYRPVLPESSAADATPAGASTMRVLRGGSFAFEARPIRVSTRNRAAQTTRGAAIGFRVALDP